PAAGPAVEGVIELQRDDAQLFRGEAVKDPLGVEGAVEAADPRVVAAHDEVGAAVVLAAERVEHRFPGPRVPHARGKRGQQHPLLGKVAVDQPEIAAKAGRRVEIVLLGRPRWTSNSSKSWRSASNSSPWSGRRRARAMPAPSRPWPAARPLLTSFLRACWTRCSEAAEMPGRSPERCRRVPAVLTLRAMRRRAGRSPSLMSRKTAPRFRRRERSRVPPAPRLKTAAESGTAHRYPSPAARASPAAVPGQEAARRPRATAAAGAKTVPSKRAKESASSTTSRVSWETVPCTSAG